MTSQDTNDKTQQMLLDNNYFGMDPNNVTIVQQGQGVPALLDNDARMALETDDDSSSHPKVITKPHGHGDIHELLHRHHVAQSWLVDRQLKWLVLFQDTNGLAFHTLPSMLGVSKSNRFILNSLAVPRKAKQAIGGIATLTHQSTGKQRYVVVSKIHALVGWLYSLQCAREEESIFTTSHLIHQTYQFVSRDNMETLSLQFWHCCFGIGRRIDAPLLLRTLTALSFFPCRFALPLCVFVRTINVEYNQLDPLLRATPGFEDGDVNDSDTGYSRFPGNINQLLFSLPEYVQVLERTKGIMPEFVNPKYSDPATKSVFKKPTRLECMMQDFPVVLEDDECSRVGFTSIDARYCFSPVKNAVGDGAALQQSGTQPGTAASGEADQYQAYRIMLSTLGCVVESADEETYHGIRVIPGPAVVLKPTFACCLTELRHKFPHPDQVSISKRSTLVIQGPGDVVIERLTLDGALVIECGEGQSAVVNRQDPIVNNGWVRVRAEANEEPSEIIKMRGYRIERLETERIVA
jgi:UTP--glucose-1-phosphate uridylyltransferase